MSKDRQAALLKRFDRPVPRYTSYPTAPHFHEGVDGAVYRSWLAELPHEQPLSLYAHIPFCDTLCWFCGCNTKITQRYEPVAAYLDLLLQEIELVAGVLGTKRAASHIHWGGGSPTILKPADIKRLGSALTAHFTLTDRAEFAVEIDPREVGEALIAALADVGVNRVSLGLQDVNLIVQEAINRVQPMTVNRQIVRMLRGHGINAVNLDLMYGLPHQTEENVRTTVREALSLDPSRIALFGYAHVPWMKTHMRMIKEDALPGPEDRLRQAEAAAEELERAGFVRIGLDHFAHADDPMTRAMQDGTLQRNFQGYTIDDAAALIGMGASSIGALPQGYVQNHTAMQQYRDAIDAGHLPTAKGIALDDDDRARREIIRELMCHLEADLGAVAQTYGLPPNAFTPERAAMAEFEEAGLVSCKGERIALTEQGRLFMRPVAAVFDRYLNKTKGQGKGKHSVAV